MKRIEAIIFDLDDTLVDTMKSDLIGIQAVYNSLPKKIENDLFFDISVKKLIEYHSLFETGKTKLEPMNKYRLLNTLNHFSIIWSDKYLNIYHNEYIKSTRCFIDTMKVLEFLKGRIFLAILTNAYDSGEQLKRISVAGLTEYFDEVVTCGDIGKFKPAKEVFLYLPDKYKIEPSKILFIGNSEIYDIAGAKKAGFYTIRLIHSDDKIVNSKADSVCYSFKELLDTISESYLFDL